MLSPYDWILLDLDNTLLDFNQCSVLAFNSMLEKMNISIDKDYYALYYPINAKYWHYYEKQKIDANEVKIGRFKEFIHSAQLSADPEEMAKLYLDQLVDYSFWIEGAQSFLNQASKKHQLALVTNGLSAAQYRRLEKHEMMRYFQHIFVSEEMGVSKPHKGFFEAVHKKIDSVPKHKVLVIGDNPVSDIKGAKNFGFDAAWFNYKKEKKGPKNANFKIEAWHEFKI